jgi:hypothetical protein
MALSVQYSDSQAKRAIYWLVAVEGVFAVAYVVIHIWLPDLTWGPFRPIFNLDKENSLPTWFSVVQLFTVGAVLLLAVANNRQEDYLSNFALTIAGLLFIALSADEGSQLHENLTYVARDLGLSQISFVGEYGAWIIVYAVLGIVGVFLGAKHLGSLWRNFKPVAVLGLVGSVTYVMGAVGFEIASFPFRDSEDTLTFNLIAVVFEEFFEMVGVSIILYATLVLANRLSAARDSP